MATLVANGSSEAMALPKPLTNGVGPSDEPLDEVDGAGIDAKDGLADIVVDPVLTNGVIENGAAPAVNGARHESPLFVSEGSPSPEAEEIAEALNPELIAEHGLAVIVPPVTNAWEYIRYEEPPLVVEILEEYDDGGLLEYLVRLYDESEEMVSLPSSSGILSFHHKIPFHPSTTCLVLLAYFTFTSCDHRIQ